MMEKEGLFAHGPLFHLEFVHYIRPDPVWGKARAKNWDNAPVGRVDSGFPRLNKAYFSVRCTEENFGLGLLHCPTASLPGGVFPENSR